MRSIYLENTLKIENGGLFISNGSGIHPERVIQSFELIFVTNGELAMQEEDTIYRLTAGDSLVLNPNTCHRGIEPYGRDLRFYWVHFNIDDHDEKILGMSSIPLIKNSRVEDINKISTLFNLLLHEQEKGLDKVTLNLFLLLIIKEIAAKTNIISDSKSIHLAQQAQSIIRTHYRKSLTSSDIARKLQCNVDYLGRIFKSNFGITLTDAIHLKKIGTAKRELIETNKTINDIANELGFNDVNYFRRVFSKYQNVSPSAYRKVFSIHSVNAE